MYYGVGESLFLKAHYALSTWALKNRPGAPHGFFPPAVEKTYTKRATLIVYWFHRLDLGYGLSKRAGFSQ